MCEQIVVLLKIYWGDAREKICEAIDNIPLSCIVIGNRGLGTLKRLISLDCFFVATAIELYNVETFGTLNHLHGKNLKSSLIQLQLSLDDDEKSTHYQVTMHLMTCFLKGHSNGNELFFCEVLK